MRSFASDNNSGVHAEVFEAMQKANVGHCVGYGDDDWTRNAINILHEHFGHDAAIFFVFLGTAANVLGLSAVCRQYHSVICAETAHINVDECGAPERFGGFKTLTIPSGNGKIAPDDVRPFLHGFGFVHHSQPRVISITQCTELGTVYSPQEVRALADLAHEHDMLLHMDGARLCNAAAALDMDFATLTRDAGVDILSFGGTKNGMMYGEAVIFFNEALAHDFVYIRKQGMQLTSKMRYVGAQFEAMVGTDLWLRNARHANAMARRLAGDVAGVQGVRITRPVETNAVFAQMDRKAIDRLREKYFFYTWDENLPEVRWMTSFDTTEQDVDEFVNALSRAVKLK